MSALLVDAHVHFHSCFDLELFLEGARSNFARYAPHGSKRGSVWGALVLTEPKGEDLFARWSGGAIERESSSWSARITGEEGSLLILFEGEPSFFLLAGRQIETREGVEILAVGSRRPYDDGIPLAEGLARVQAEGEIAVLPWGFGKWWGERGRIVKGMVREGNRTRFFLGDNRSRPRGLPPSPLFRIAAERGIGLLSGSDPLPFPSHNRTAGSFGSLVEATIDPRRPLEALTRALSGKGARPPAYGKRGDLVSFCRDQLRLRLPRRVRA